MSYEQDGYGRVEDSSSSFRKTVVTEPRVFQSGTNSYPSGHLAAVKFDSSLIPYLLQAAH